MGPVPPTLITSNNCLTCKDPFVSVDYVQEWKSSFNVCHLTEQKLKAEKQGEYTEKSNVENQSML